jgi:hypothetical protein
MCDPHLALADDTVLIEPVSMINFPANREINREVRRFLPPSPIYVLIPREISDTCRQIPMRTEQGIFGLLSGKTIRQNREFSDLNSELPGSSGVERQANNLF